MLNLSVLDVQSLVGKQLDIDDGDFRIDCLCVCELIDFLMHVLEYKYLAPVV